MGSYINSSENYFKSEKALHALKLEISRIKSGVLTCPIPLNSNFQIPILLYGSETWTITKTILKSLDGCYTNLLKRVQNLDWRNQLTLHEIYRGLPRISSVLTSRMLSFSGHCFRAKHEIISDILLWCPDGLKAQESDIFILKRETGLEVEELGTAMADREQ